MARVGSHAGKARSGKRPSRAQERERLLARAAEVTVDERYDVAVIGGGAAGLAAAISSAEAGAKTLVLESAPECGRSILATGNGRCNFSTVELGAERFNDPEFVGQAFGDDPLGDILNFFRDSNMRWALEDGRLYPLSRRAASVRNVLLRRAREAGATLAPARPVTSVERDGKSFSLAFEQLFDEGRKTRTRAGRVVVATGGGAAEALGPLGLEVTETRKVLCPIACEDSPLAALDGCRAQVRAQLSHGMFPCWSERGEVLFRSYGLSGIVIFNMSREVLAGDLVAIDLVPDVNVSELRQMIDPFMHGDFEDGCVDGVVDPKIASVLGSLARSGWQGPSAEDPTDESASERLIGLLKGLPFRTLGTTDASSAQVTRGGLKNDQFDATTLEALRIPGLFACGETLDVDGACGGYNLSWAWKSGMVAGSAAAQA